MLTLLYALLATTLFKDFLMGLIFAFLQCERYLLLHSVYVSFLVMQDIYYIYSLLTALIASSMNA